MSFDIKGFKNPHLKDFSEYKTMYEQSVKDPSKFFHEQALKEIDWFNEPKMGFSGEFTKPIWFEDGILNISYNCIDRHLDKNSKRQQSSGRETKKKTLNIFHIKNCLRKFQNYLMGLKR